MINLPITWSSIFLSINCLKKENVMENNHVSFPESFDQQTQIHVKFKMKQNRETQQIFTLRKLEMLPFFKQNILGKQINQ